MVDSLVWNKKSIINIDKDTMSKSTGTATVSNSSLVLGANSSATYNYSYATTDNTMKTSNLKFILDVLNSDKTVNSRYNEDVQVEVYIQYYKKQLDTNGNETGYVLGINDTYQINPYFNHEEEGYTSVYELEIKDEFMVFIEINFINNSSNTITFINPQVFNSMSVMDAIDEYGGGGGGGDTPPLIKALTLYGLEEKYTIDKMNESLTLQVFIPDEYVNKYKENLGIRWDVYVKYTFTTISGNPVFSHNESELRQEYTKDDGTKDTIVISDGRCNITSVGGNGVMRVRAELEKNSTIYAERDITVTNNNVTDMTLTIDTDSGKVDGKQVLNAAIKIIPENNRSGVGGAYNDIKISVASYDGEGSVRLLDDAHNEYYTMDYKLTGGVVNFQLRGQSNGKVRMTVEILSLTTQSYQRLFPSGFKKEFIVDVINVPVTPVIPDLYISKIDDNIGEGTSESYKIYVTTSRSNELSTDSTYGIQSVDGAGKARVKLLTTSDSKTLTYEIFPIAVGKVKFYGEMNEVISPVTQYLGRVEYEFNITSLYKELTGIVETNTGLFEITQGGGQLEVYPRPNYSWYGGYSFSQVSLDGGSVTIEDKGNYALITGNKNGRLELICTPTYGPNLSCEITVSNQYPEDVKLITADNIFKVPINGTLMIYAEAGNKPNSNYDKYTWISEKLDADVNWNITAWNKDASYKGLNLGKIRVSVQRKVDDKFMTSQVIKVVQSLDSDKTVLTYPNSQKYWVVYRKTNQNNRLWLITTDGTVTLDKLIKKTDNWLYTDNVTLGAYAQYKIENGQWANYGSWTGGTSLSGSVGQLYASNLDIYDENGNLLLAKTDNYDDVDFDKIIYG